MFGIPDFPHSQHCRHAAFHGGTLRAPACMNLWAEWRPCSATRDIMPCHISASVCQISGQWKEICFTLFLFPAMAGWSCIIKSITSYLESSLDFISLFLLVEDPFFFFFLERCFSDSWNRINFHTRVLSDLFMSVCSGVLFTWVKQQFSLSGSLLHSVFIQCMCGLSQT